ncbi:MAG: hypothetical protein AB7O37_23145 [Vicinamibacteria bacterium]
MRTPAVAILLSLLAGSAAAQNEAALRGALEGRSVVVRIDLPASHKGVDLRFDKPQPFNERENAQRIRDFDLALRSGDRVPITQIKVKDDMIEFQLAGGGFNWGTQSTTETFSSTPKSNREKDLDDQIKRETDRERKRSLERERDDLRSDRTRRDDDRRREVEYRNERARERDRARAERSGSRFNLRFKKAVPADALTPDGLLRYLAPWVEAPGAASGARRDDRDERDDREDARDPDEEPGGLRKGMSRVEVQRALGRPVRQEECKAGSFDCARIVFADGREEVEAIFVEDVLVAFSRRPR